VAGASVQELQRNRVTGENVASAELPQENDRALLFLHGLPKPGISGDPQRGAPLPS